MCCVSLCKLLFHITLEMQIVLLVVEIQNFPCTVLQENVCRKRGWGGMLWSEHQQLYWVYGEMWGNTNGVQRLIHTPQIWGLPTVPKAAVRSLPMVTHADLKVIRGDTTIIPTAMKASREGATALKLQSQGLNPGWVTPECSVKPVWASTVLDREAWPLSLASKGTAIKEPSLLSQICVTVVPGQQAHCCTRNDSIPFWNPIRRLLRV